MLSPLWQRSKTDAVTRPIASSVFHGPSVVIALCTVSALLLTCALTHARPEVGSSGSSLRSPDGAIEFRIKADGGLTCEIYKDGKRLMGPANLGLRFRDQGTLGPNARIVKIHKDRRNSVWENEFGKNRKVKDKHNELRVQLADRKTGRPFEVVARVFNDGVGFRYVLPEESRLGAFILEEELTEFVFPGNYPCYAGEHDKNTGHTGAQEWEFKQRSLGSIKTNSIVGLPLLVQADAAWVCITEADLRDWSGMWLTGAQPGREQTNERLQVKLAPRLDGDGLVKSSAPRSSPWRVLMIADQPGALIESDLILNLATPCELDDTSWIVPGKMAWDNWWSGDVKMDTATLKEFIQLAADMGWPYQLIDWQWYGPFNKPDSDITKVNPAVDMEEVRRFALEKGVRLWLWLYWTDVERDLAYQKAFQLYESWGIAGVKIDFMDRDDQEMVNWYERITRAAAAHKLMVNFHGAFKPTGLNRTLPNQITREGILGNEYNRWSKRVTPGHKLMLPFTRLLAGPGDFTPGGFLNRQPVAFKQDGKSAKVQGTRAAELALFVAYDSPICCICDHPKNYAGQPGTDWLKIVPTVWDETRVLQGYPGEQLVIARRTGTEWFLGALTDEARQVTIPLSFLGRGEWNARLWKDTPDSAMNAERIETEERSVRPEDNLSVWLAPAGGTVAHFRRAGGR